MTGGFRSGPKFKQSCVEWRIFIGLLYAPHPTRSSRVRPISPGCLPGLERDEHRGVSQTAATAAQMRDMR